MKRGVSARAYADDGLLLVKANTSLELIGKSSRVLEIVMRWGEERNLTFSKEKTVIVLLKGKGVERFIRVDMKGVQVEASAETKNLGVVIRTGMKFAGQYDQVMGKTDYEGIHKTERTSQGE